MNDGTTPEQINSKQGGLGKSGRKRRYTLAARPGEEEYEWEEPRVTELNPNWVEQLMELSFGWTDLALGAELSTNRRARRNCGRLTYRKSTERCEAWDYFGGGINLASTRAERFINNHTAKMPDNKVQDFIYGRGSKKKMHS